MLPTRRPDPPNPRVRARGRIAGVIGRRLGVPVVGKTREEAADHFGRFAHLTAMDVPTASERTRARLGRAPEQPGLIADVDQPGYGGG
jgi:hypothetical protein